MATCQDCGSPVVWLKKPDGSWLPPVEPLFDFAYNDHYTATVDGIAQPVPQVYKQHECLSWEERQRKQLEREREKRELIEADRARRAEAERVQRELEEARKAQEEAERKLQEQLEREERRRRARAEARRREKEVERELERRTNYGFPKRLLPVPCRDCNAERGEPCRTDLWRSQVAPYLWWRDTGHGSRYADAPPDDRSKVVVPERWGEDYHHDRGTTPDTVGPWPPARTDPGRYDMVAWLRRHYVDVFEPEKRWLSDEETRTLADWLHQFGDVFKEVNDEPGGVAQPDPDPGPEGLRGRDARRARREQEAGDRVHPEGRGGDAPSSSEQEDRGQGAQPDPMN